MDPKIQQLAQSLIARHTKMIAGVKNVRSISGGSINQAFQLELADGRSYFIKTNSNPPPNLFLHEAEGLAALAEPHILSVPKVVAHQDQKSSTPNALLVLEYITPAHPNPSCFQVFGEQLAEHHRKTARDQFGWPRANYIGSTIQQNHQTKNWIEFWRDQRLGFQLKLAKKNGYNDKNFHALAEQLLKQLDAFLGDSNEPACLLHGDLWSGNMICDQIGNPVVIDPAVYYGHREAELAMTELFGGFPERFIQAYQSSWPLTPGYQDRLEIYKLYHLLNHLNIFGGSYFEKCYAILKRFTA